MASSCLFPGNIWYHEFKSPSIRYVIIIIFFNRNVVLFIYLFIVEIYFWRHTDDKDMQFVLQFQSHNRYVIIV